MEKLKRPLLTEVSVKDSFWTPYIDNIRNIFMPHALNKFEECGYVKRFEEVAAKSTDTHPGPPFSDGLLYECIRGASDFLALKYDAELDKRLDNYIEKISSAQDENGYISTWTTQERKGMQWGLNGGDILVQHDLYNHGALVEAAVSHYNATKKTTLLEVAVKSANNVCREIGYPPKKKVVPGHSIAEEAHIKLYRLFRDTRELDSFAKEHNVNEKDYLDIVNYWYSERGYVQSSGATFYQNQNHLPFAEQTTAEGHAVRAMLFYLGAAALVYETDNQEYKKSLDTIWHDVVYKKMLITGGVGTRHDTEGFGAPYDLPHNSYLETCAGISFAFWNGEMALLDTDSKYFDCFELALYNNILGAVAGDFKRFCYQNPLVHRQAPRRNEWHACPCCPPMLLKIYSALGTYIYSLSEETLCVNMYVGSSLETKAFSVEQTDKKFRISSKGKVITLKLRIPSYSEGFKILSDGKEVDYTVENGYATLRASFDNTEIEVLYDEPIRRIYSHYTPVANVGRVAVMKGIQLMCAEGIDNNNDIDFMISDTPSLCRIDEKIKGKTSEGKDFFLTPYYQWGNRPDADGKTKMQIWLEQENMPTLTKIRETINEKLYGVYEKMER